MSGWRDTEGRTRTERARERRREAHGHALDTVRHRPLSLLKPALALGFILILIAALLLR
jgi:hypothetical protein